MCHLGPTKSFFVVCLVISVLVGSLIYWSADVPAEPKSRAECRPFAPQCKPFLLGYNSGLRWHRQNCEVEHYIANNTLNCSTLISDFNFITAPLSKEEEEYPLAFILTIHKERELFIRLLRAIYMPQNVYCIHMDAKVPLEYKVSVHKLANCFENVFVTGRSETVTYAGYSRLQADLNCMEELVQSRIRWRKVLNVCGQDFPIMSNLELVRYMQSEKWKDKNMTPGVKQPTKFSSRTSLQHIEMPGNVRRIERVKLPPPRRIQVYFGTAYYALTREFVKFVLTSQVAQEFLVWSRDTYSPDEHFWVTLNHIREAPGSYLTGGWEGSVRAIKWSDQEGASHDGCKGRYVRDICVYGTGDLPWIFKRDSMFANKFESGTYPEALDCLEAWHRIKVLMQATVPIEPTWLLAIPYSRGV
ncbi:beta-1,3-galactosyl-O-glycosyl-glycoprotein beta-1,6-N-acetylglucosaminyltransferase 7 [Eucyclogobius newberryi]|uniref:beta-1,3-galactosyl-O-glycosyl-glycoprotein beta-1,6-N-acetylglucosaminyltransferase 7 n=1 Tax=Eucyclogobius newberryi TaxID=166745 RepID=UPI003B5B9D91